MKILGPSQNKLRKKDWIFNLLIFIFPFLTLSFVIRSPCVNIEKNFLKYAGAQDSEYKEEDLSQSDKGEEFEVKVQGVVVDSVSRSPVVILVTKDKQRFVPYQ